MPNGSPLPGGPDASRRRSQRVILSLRVIVRTEDGPKDASFEEETHTLIVNAHGALIALAGGALGNAVSRGPQRGAGTALGAILGGALGASVGNKQLTCEDRSTVYRTYYSGFEKGRAHARYQWRSPRTNAYGYLEVGDYYRSPQGERCATYTQRIFVQGEPEVAAGHACRQPDGHWVLVD